MNTPHHTGTHHASYLFHCPKQALEDLELTALNSFQQCIVIACLCAPEPDGKGLTIVFEESKPWRWQGGAQ
jgi:hypothetical protein